MSEDIDLLTVAEVAKKLRISVQTVTRNLIETGRLPHINLAGPAGVNRKIRVPVSWLGDFIARGGM